VLSIRRHAKRYGLTLAMMATGVLGSSAVLGNDVETPSLRERIATYTPEYRGFLSGTYWESVAKTVDLNPVFLFAVALAESGFETPAHRGFVAPMPWVVRSVEGPQFFKNKTQAVRYTQGLIEQGVALYNIDVGFMQLNLHWQAAAYQQHGLEGLFEPAVNLAVGAQLARKCIQSTSDIELGVGRYNGWKTLVARRYGKKVLQIFRNLSAWDKTA